MHGGLSLARGEDDGGSTLFRFVVEQAGQALLGSLHQQPIEVDARQLGVEIAARGDDPLNPPSTQAREITIGLSVVTNRA